MSTSNGGGEASPPQSLTPQSSALFSEGVSLVLSRWTALLMAVENQWGEGDPRQKSHDLASEIFSWFTQSQDLYIDDLEDMLDRILDEYFSTVVEDGSIEEVAERLMIMHEECLSGNYESIEKLRNLAPAANAGSRSKKVVNDDDEDKSSDEETSDMMVDEQQPMIEEYNTSAVKQALEVAAHRPVHQETPEADGWMVVAPKRNKGRRSS